MDSEEKELINEIRGELIDFEIPYEEGRWENFLESYGEQLGAGKRKGGRIIFSPLKWLAAAAVLAGVVLYMPWTLKEDGGDFAEWSHQDIAPLHSEPQNSPVREEKYPVVVTTNTHQSTHNSIPANHPDAPAGEDGLTGGTDRPELPELTSPEEKLPSTSLSSLPISKKNNAALLHRRPPPTFAARHSENPSLGFQRWKFGVELQSSFVTDKSNLAAGIVTQFAVSEKISVSAGLTYWRISATHHGEPVQVSKESKITGGESMMQALDIPFALAYEPADGWYASAGMSALSVFDENKTYRIETEKLQESLVADPSNGALVSVFEVVKSEHNEKSNETDFKGRSNLRYLNFSVGRKQKFNNHSDILLEPFVKIPMGGLKHNDINLFHSGIKVKVLF